MRRYELEMLLHSFAVSREESRATYWAREFAQGFRCVVAIDERDGKGLAVAGHDNRPTVFEHRIRDATDLQNIFKTLDTLEHRARQLGLMPNPFKN